MSCYHCEGEPTCRTCADLDERMGEEALAAYHGRHYAKYLLDRRRVAEEKLTRIAETIDHYQAVVDAARAWAGDYAAISDDSPPEDRALFDAVRALARLNCCPRDECACCEAHGAVIDAVRALDDGGAE